MGWNCLSKGSGSLSSGAPKDLGTRERYYRCFDILTMGHEIFTVRLLFLGLHFWPKAWQVHFEVLMFSRPHWCYARSFGSTLDAGITTLAYFSSAYTGVVKHCKVRPSGWIGLENSCIYQFGMLVAPFGKDVVFIIHMAG